MANEVETLIFKAQTSDLVRARKDLNKLEKAANDAGKATDDGGKKQRTFGQILSQNKGKIAAAVAGFTALAFAINRGLNIVEEAGAEFSILNARLVTATGSTANAAAAFKELNAFALETPFTLQESVNGFAKLTNLGLEPSRESMTSFANTAAAMGTSLEQMIEAVADATTFEFERLKEFGIKTKQETDKVIFSFRGTTTEVEKNAKAVQEFLEGIGTDTFADAAIQQTTTLAGSISNLQQGFDLLKINAGLAAGATDVFAKSNNDLATTIKDPEFVEGLGRLTKVFADIKASVVTVLSGAVVGAVDILTTTTSEQVGKVENKIARFQRQIEMANKTMEFQISKGASEEVLEQIQNRIDHFEGLIAQARGTITQLTGDTADDATGTGIDGDGGTPMSDEAKAEAEAIENIKQTQLDFLEFKKSLIPTALDILKEEHLRKLEAEKEYKENLLAIKQEEAQGLTDIEQSTADTINSIKGKGAKTGISMLTTIAKKGLGESKKSAIAAVAIDAAGAAAQILIDGAVGSQAIRLQHQTQASLIPDPTGATQAAIIAKGETLAAANMVKSKAIAGATAAVRFGTGALGVALGGGGGSTSSSVGGDTAAGGTMAQEQQFESPRQPETIVNVSVDNSIDPEGARRIVEAINEATSDGLEITALVS